MTTSRHNSLESNAPARPPASPLWRRSWAGPLLLTTILLIVVYALAPLLASGAPARASLAAELPTGCPELVMNRFFEEPSAVWTILGSAHPAAYVNSPVKEGAWSMRVGNPEEGPPNTPSESRFEQFVAIPEETGSVVLSFWYLAQSQGPPDAGDQQFLDLYDASSGELLQTIFSTQSDDRIWMMPQYDITEYVGRTLLLSFGARNDGGAARIGMWVDEVSVTACVTSPMPTATTDGASPTPTNTPTALAPSATPSTTASPSASPTASPTPIPTLPAWPTNGPPVYPTFLPTTYPPVWPTNGPPVYPTFEPPDYPPVYPPV